MCDSSKNLLQHKYIKDNYDCSKVMITVMVVEDGDGDGGVGGKL
jgi:hypothetical protein